MEGKKKSLIIVESPTKVKTIRKVLSRGFTILASIGHIKDLPPDKFGVQIDNDFRPYYKIIKGKAKVLKEIKRASKNAAAVYLAPDPDREGEAIAWHIAEEISSLNSNIFRVMFNELTEKGIINGIKNPLQLDKNRYDSYKARRILDRIVGYKISPLLWWRVASGLSAGRVQSVAVRMIVEREGEIDRFKPEEYWTVMAHLEGEGIEVFQAKLFKIDGNPAKIGNEEDASRICEQLRNERFFCSGIQTKMRRRKPSAPFTTSTMQQMASTRLHFPSKQTMVIAQQLYEGVECGDEGHVGLITYMRTDSTRVSEEAREDVQRFISSTFGRQYVPKRPHYFKKQKSAQEAHEAIRPTSVFRTPESVKRYLSNQQFSLYELIWKRFVASQMEAAEIEQIVVDITAGRFQMRATGSKIRFDGYAKLYDSSELGEEQTIADNLKEGSELSLVKLDSKQHFTQPPARYTEASIIKELERRGIGRPSTYSQIISTIQERNYVVKQDGKFRPTEVGLLVNKLLVDHFPEVVDFDFTARMEESLDLIEEGKRGWVETLGEFWQKFSTAYNSALQQMPRLRKETVRTDIKCDRCGSEMVMRLSKRGRFLSCSMFPDCRNAKSITVAEDGSISLIQDEKLNGVCPECGGGLLRKRGRYGEFISCSEFPDCKYSRPVSTGIPCPNKGCDGELIRKRSKTGRSFFGCNRYPDCSFTLWGYPVKKQCPQCGSSFLIKGSRNKTLQCANPGCDYHTEAGEI